MKKSVLLLFVFSCCLALDKGTQQGLLKKQSDIIKSLEQAQKTIKSSIPLRALRQVSNKPGQLEDLVEEALVNSQDLQRSMKLIFSQIKEPAPPVQKPRVEDKPTGDQKSVKSDTEPLLPLLSAKSVSEAKTNLNNFLRSIDADNIKEAQENIDEIEELAKKQLLSVFQTASSVLNAPAFKRTLAQKNVLEKGVKELNQQLFDTIFELKKSYYESLQQLDGYAQPLLQELEKAIKKKQEILTLKNTKERRQALEELLNLIPDKMPAAPKLESIPKQELIKRVKDLEVK